MMKRIVVDSGSTKTIWVLYEEKNEIKRFEGTGMNPVVMPRKELDDIISAAVDELGHPDVESVEFYGAGCRPDCIGMMSEMLMKYIAGATIVVGSDMVGAAKALLGKKEGIACILGTGSNSCLWDGDKVVENTPCMGFILGDEGGGAVMGKLFLNALYKGRLGSEILEIFERENQLNINSIIDLVYRKPSPNRFLASLCPFIRKNIDKNDVLEELVMDNFRAFFRNNIKPYQREDLEVNFVGSIAFYFDPWLRRAGELEGYKVGQIKKAPL